MSEGASGVQRIGGVFLATADVPRLVAWYRALGIPVGEDGFCVLPEGASPVEGAVFSIMPAQGDLTANPAEDVEEEPYGRRRVTLNLRVIGLDAVVAGLQDRGDAVAGPKDYGYGRFAWVHDPDGNVVEIWEAAPH